MADLTKEDLWEVARRFFPESVKFMDRTRDFLQGYQGEIRQQVTARALYAFLKKDGFFKAIGDTPMSYRDPEDCRPVHRSPAAAQADRKERHVAPDDQCGLLDGFPERQPADV
jgi:hypothetical protein